MIKLVLKEECLRGIDNLGNMGCHFYNAPLFSLQFLHEDLTQEEI